MAGVETAAAQHVAAEGEGKVVDAARTESDGATMEYLACGECSSSKGDGSPGKSMNSIVWCLPDTASSSSGEAKDGAAGGKWMVSGGGGLIKVICFAILEEGVER